MGYVARRYFKTISKASNHARYIAFRDRLNEFEKKGLFTEKEDLINTFDFTKNLESNLTKHQSVAVAHTLLFSMSGDEFKRSGFEYGDYKEMVRDIMQKYQLEKGIKLDWAAAEHFKPNNPHCHVIIKSTFKDRDGVEHRLKLTKDDVAWFRDSFEEKKDKMRGFDKEHLMKIRSHDLRRERNKHKNRQLTTNLLDSLIYQIKRKAKEKEYEQERGL